MGGVATLICRYIGLPYQSYFRPGSIVYQYTQHYSKGGTILIGRNDKLMESTEALSLEALQYCMLLRERSNYLAAVIFPRKLTRGDHVNTAIIFPRDRNIGPSHRLETVILYMQGNNTHSRESVSAIDSLFLLRFRTSAFRYFRFHTICLRTFVPPLPTLRNL